MTSEPHQPDSCHHSNDETRAEDMAVAADRAGGGDAGTGGGAGGSGGGGSGGRGVISIIRDLQSGAVAGRNLPIDDRRRCVEHLTAEGYSVPEIAEILGVAERTIARDRAAVREANALHVSPGFVAETAGQLLRQAEATVARLHRIARERDCPHAVRVDAERNAWATQREVVQVLQRLGYLPEAAHQVRAEVAGEVTFGGLDAPSFEELAAEAARLERIASCAGPAAAPMLASVCEIRGAITRLDVAERVASAGRQLQEQSHDSVDTDR